MPKVKSEKTGSGWGNGQLFGSAPTENTFQGGGFKDKDKALETIRLLDGRDVTYQYQIINSMYNRAKVIYKRTTDKDKRKNLSEAVDTFEEWIDDYKTNSKAKQNFSYLNMEMVEGVEPLGRKYKIEDFNFLKVYKEADGDLKQLRNKKVDGKDITWDIERNNKLKALNKKIKEELIPLYETEGDLKGLPSKEHTQMILYGYSPDSTKVKKCISLMKEKKMFD